MTSPAYGEVWYGGLDPTVGHEQAGRRPVLVVSVTEFNETLARLAFVMPITSTMRPLRWHVPLAPPEGGLTRPSVILCEAMRSVSHDRLERRMGAVSPQTMLEVQDRLRILLDL